ncbi:hypothetical protein VR010_11660 [Actinomycetaceae bacterium L2_0104]
MVTWRPVTGEIIRFDRSLATIESFEEYFATNRIIARGRDGGDSYHVELAVTGRRRRVACLDEEGAVVPGSSLAELVESMDKELRKVQIDIGGHVAWGNIDLGEVDVTWDDVDALGTAPEPALDEEGIEGEYPEVLDGPMLLISDLSFAELPRYAAQTGSPIAAFELGKANVVLADTPMPRRKAHASPLFVIMLSMDPGRLENPILAVRQEGSRLVWNWDYDLADVPWVAQNEVARAFAQEQLGEGAFVTRVCADLPEANRDLLRAALLGVPDDAGRHISQALNLPVEVGDCLEGLLEARLIPGSVVFEPKPFTERLQTTVAYEVAGHGRATPTFWKVYRKLYLEHPHMMEAFASAQAGLGVIMFAAGVKKWNRPSGKVLAGIGGALAVNSGTRILTTQWVQAALQYEGLLPRAFSSDSAPTAPTAETAPSVDSAE